MTGTLFIVPTPIGNLEDITLRALRVLREVDFVAAEDTRHTRKLLTHYDIHPKSLFSYHEHNTRHAGALVLQRLLAGESGALVSDAGMPGISDPGHDLIRLLLEESIVPVALPGPSAFVTGLVASGLATDRFLFVGFLPREKKTRRSELEALAKQTATLLFYEAPHRILATLDDLFLVFGNRQCVIARELSKVHETFHRGQLGDSQWRAGLTLRGEMVVMVEGATISEATTSLFSPTDAESIVSAVDGLIAQGLDKKEAMRQVAQAAGLSRRDVYQTLLDRDQ